MKRLIALPLALALAGCFGRDAPAPVLVPVTVPCVRAEQIPAEPARVQDQLSGDSGHDIGVIAGSAIELRAWGGALRTMLVACAGTAPIAPVDSPPAS